MSLLHYGIVKFSLKIATKHYVVDEIDLIRCIILSYDNLAIYRFNKNIMRAAEFIAKNHYRQQSNSFTIPSNFQAVVSR